MVKNLPPLDGTDVNWSLYQSQFVKSTIVWVIIAIVCLILFIVLKYDRIKKAVSYISVFLLFGLSYMDIPYKKWLGYIWKFFAVMLASLLIIFTILWVI